jgi:hypothetical protein
MAKQYHYYSRSRSRRRRRRLAVSWIAVLAAIAGVGVAILFAAPSMSEYFPIGPSVVSDTPAIVIWSVWLTVACAGALAGWLVVRIPGWVLMDVFERRRRRAISVIAEPDSGQSKAGQIGPIHRYRQKAASGDPTAQFALALIYRVGHGVEADPDEARRWLNAAAQQGHQSAQRYLDSGG